MSNYFARLNMVQVISWWLGLNIQNFKLMSGPGMRTRLSLRDLIFTSWTMTCVDELK